MASKGIMSFSRTLLAVGAVLSLVAVKMCLPAAAAVEAHVGVMAAGEEDTCSSSRSRN